MLTRVCPRCERGIAVLRTPGPGRDLYRHKDWSTGRWCSQQPKSFPELLTDILDSMKAEREVMRRVVEAYLDFGEVLVVGSEEHTALSTRTTVLIGKATDRVVELAEQRKAERNAPA